MTDLYNILGVTKESSIDDIKKSYKNLALKCHPDKNNSPDACEEFKKLAEAYSVLSDPDKRKLYDEGGIDAVKESINLPNDIFTEFMSKFCEPMITIQNIEIIIDVTLEEIYSGCSKDIEIERYDVDDDAKYLINKHKLNIVIQKGCFSGNLLHIRNEGNEYPDRSGITDVIVRIREIKHENFKRNFMNKGKNYIDPMDLMMKLHISFEESIIGFTKRFKHISGDTLIISYDKPTRHKDILIMEHKGMPNLKDDSKFGDLLIKIIVDHPDKLNLKFNIKQKICQLITNKSIEMMTKMSDDIMTFDKYKSLNYKEENEDEDEDETLKTGYECTQQ